MAPQLTPELLEAQRNLQHQVATGGISQGQADAELNRLISLGPPLYDPAVVGGQLGGITQDPAVSSGIQAGFGLGNTFFAPGALPRLTTDPNLQPYLDRNLIASRNIAIDALNPNAQYQQALPGQQRLAQIELERYNKGGSKQFRQLVPQAKELFAQSGVVDPALQAALDERRARMGGLTAEERTLMEEQGRGEINRGLQTALRAAGQTALGANLQGGAASALAAPAIGAYADQLRQLQGDIGRFNIGLRDQRLGAFEQLAGQIDQNRSARQLGTFQNLSNLIQGGEAQRFGQTAAAVGGLSNLLAGQAQFEQGNRLATQALSNQNAFDQLAANNAQGIFNIGQRQNEIAGLLGTTFQTGAFSAQEAGRLAAEEQARRALDSARSF